MVEVFAALEPAPEPDRNESIGPRTAVCIATCGRPDGLARLLSALRVLVFTTVPAPDLRIVVVENGAPSGARSICAEFARSSIVPLQYEHEPRVGIPFARNRAVRCAVPWAEFVLFLDDDELPTPTFLDELFQVQRRFQADVVAGPVVRRFDEPAPEWAVRGRFFDRSRWPTGTERQFVATNNTLVKSTVFATVGDFDSRFAFSGGSDTHFFLRAHLRGCRLIWADEAIVYEFMPPSRATVAWLLQRAFRSGNTWSLCERELWPSRRVQLRRLVLEMRNALAGTVSLIPALFSGRVAMIACLRRICEAAGNISGVFGFRYEEYHPSRIARVARET